MQFWKCVIDSLLQQASLAKKEVIHMKGLIIIWKIKDAHSPNGVIISEGYNFPLPYMRLLVG